jgi:hypothetical protein
MIIDDKLFNEVIQALESRMFLRDGDDEWNDDEVIELLDKLYTVRNDATTTPGGAQE